MKPISRSWRWLLAGVVFAIAIAIPLLAPTGADSQKLRPAGAAGGFYPADPQALTAMMDGFLSQVSLPAIDGQILAAVAPHAGYQYSGPVAAYAYAALKGQRYARVVILAPSHYEAFGFTSVYDGGGYITPLGTVPVDTRFARDLVHMSSSMRLSERGQAATAAGAEHAIEVQLPWLQHVLGSFTLVPIVMGEQSYESSRALGLALARMIQLEEQKDATAQKPAGGTLILASSDLSHYHSYADAVRMDHKTLNSLEARDHYTMTRNFASGVWEACGGGPIVAAMIAAEQLGANQARVLRYANSGDVTGERTRVVGYSTSVFLKAPAEKAAEAPFTLSDAQKKQLLALAHQSVVSAVRSRSPLRAAATGDPSLDQERGAFVTLKSGGELRGCVGYSMAAKPLYETVADAAAYAAVHDPRFSPVTEKELQQLEYEISVLSPLTRVTNIQQIELGRHGLLLKSGHREGLLLPQVPVEQQWDRTTFLQQTCFKASMTKNCWKSEDTDIFRFTALVFNDRPPAAELSRVEETRAAPALPRECKLQR
ncbi:MAG: AmmeMemoRadiSam system protein B [Acidobacteriota bacterium]